RRLANDEADRGLVISDRIGVRHRAHRGESTSRRRARTRRDRLDVFTSRLTQMAVHVDEARRDDLPVAIDYLRVVRRIDVEANRFNSTTAPQKVRHVFSGGGRIGPAPAFEIDFALWH